MLVKSGVVIFILRCTDIKATLFANYIYSYESQCTSSWHSSNGSCVACISWNRTARFNPLIHCLSSDHTYNDTFLRGGREKDTTKIGISLSGRSKRGCRITLHKQRDVKHECKETGRSLKRIVTLTSIQYNEFCLYHLSCGIISSK